MVVQVTGLQLQYELSLYISYFHTIASVLGRPAPTALPRFRCRVPTLIEQCYLLYMYFTMFVQVFETVDYLTFHLPWGLENFTESVFMYEIC